MLKKIIFAGAMFAAGVAHAFTPQTGTWVVDAELNGKPGRGFGLGFTVLTDPLAAASPESVGTWRMGGTYGHSWFVDPAQELSVVAFTNTALEGMAGPFVTELCQAMYGREPGQ